MGVSRQATTTQKSINFKNLKKLELQQFKEIINLSNSLEQKRRKGISYLIKLTKNFGHIYKEELTKLPYHINLIDELHTDENAHSRIFAKLLRYQENYKFVFLEKFLTDVCLFDLTTEKPEVKKVDSCGRIDIPIFDNKYVVVIENKVTDKAPDQNNSNGGQLARYIETLKNVYNRKQEEIYVVYTPKFTRNPSNESWVNKNNFSYKKDFSNRFRSLSYKDNIYPWLKYEILPYVNKNNTYLYSAVEQYIDHLEGMFSLRTINQPMNMKLQEFIKQELGIKDSNLEESIEILSEKEEELNSILNQIQQLKSNYKKEIIKKLFIEWKEMLQLDFPNQQIVGDSFKLDQNIINLGIQFNIENKKFVAIIECNNCDKPNLYFGIGRHYSSKEKFELNDKLNDLLENSELSEPENYWYGWRFTSIESGYFDLKKLISNSIS